MKKENQEPKSEVLRILFTPSDEAKLAETANEQRPRIRFISTFLRKIYSELIGAEPLFYVVRLMDRLGYFVVHDPTMSEEYREQSCTRLDRLAARFRQDMYLPDGSPAPLDPEIIQESGIDNDWYLRLLNELRYTDPD